MKRIICLCCIFVIMFNMSVLAEGEVEINAKSAVLMEADTGKVLYSESPDTELPIASVTKIMTMLLIM